MYIKDTLYNIKFYILLFVIAVTFFSCSKEDYEAQEPTYISIPSISLTTDYATEGSASSNITDAWVFVNDDLVGVYTLPAKFPVLKEGTVVVKVFAGIKDNGISAARTIYSLYDPYQTTETLVKGETIEINPVVSYSASAKFTWMEDFESASLSFLYTSGSDTTINKQSSDVKEGAYSGLVSLTDAMDFFEATSVAYTSLPKSGTPVYLEFDFKTNERMLTGLYLDNNQFAAVTLNPTSSWKRIYINLTDLVGTSSASTEIKVFMGIQEIGSTVFLTSNPLIYLDNIKLVHF